jgi:hypothetical protein
MEPEPQELILPRLWSEENILLQTQRCAAMMLELTSKALGKLSCCDVGSCHP